MSAGRALQVHGGIHTVAHCQKRACPNQTALPGALKPAMGGRVLCASWQLSFMGAVRVGITLSETAPVPRTRRREYAPVMHAGSTSSCLSHRISSFRLGAS